MAFLGIGNPFGDRYAEVDDAFLERNGLEKNRTHITLEKELLEKTWKNIGIRAPQEISLGGSATNVIKVLAHLGNKTALLGKIGSDSLGKKLTENLQKIGVELFLSKSPKETGVVNCFITEDKARTMQTYLGSASDFCSEDLIPKPFLKKSVVHIEGYMIYNPDVIEKSIKAAKKEGAIVSLDLSSSLITTHTLLKKRLIPSLNRVDLIFGNVEEFLGLTNAKNVKTALTSPLLHDTKLIVITNGGRGCWVKEKNEEEKLVDLSSVDPIIDTTGAGDYFIAGFLHSFIRKEPLVDCIQSGHLAASTIIQEKGTNLSLASWRKLKSRLHNFS